MLAKKERKSLMRRRIGLLVAAVIMAVTMAFATVPAFAGGDDDGDDDGRFSLCHATGSETNPFVFITVSAQGFANHLANHPDDFPADSPADCEKK
jgi:hypothetical protein